MASLFDQKPFQKALSAGEGTSVELHSFQCPAASNADGLSQFQHIIVGKVIAEDIPDIMEQILSINEGNSALNGRFGGHEETQKK
jgi:hypothetical protein